ncbi:hypothetical protein CRYUN_Cryun21dG0099700 [Craigia yunnanensis]
MATQIQHYQIPCFFHFYLHGGWDEQVIHRNITSSAIILDPKMNPRLSSFSLAEFLTRNDHGHHAAINKNKSVRGIFGYMSPEYMESGEATPTADVYSFDVVVLKVVTGQMAAEFCRPEVQWRIQNKELLRLAKLGIACTRSDLELRLTMRQIVSILDGNDKASWEKGRGRRVGKNGKERNASSLSLVRRIQSLGIH